MDEAGFRERLRNSKPGQVIWMTREEHNYMMTHTEELITEREKTHGSFEANAQAYLNFWKIPTLACLDKLNPEQHLALSMIFVKLSRMMQNPHIKDHWDDIAGYAKLGSDACK